MSENRGYAQGYCQALDDMVVILEDHVEREARMKVLQAMARLRKAVTGGD